jgi:UDP-N-acetylglucosamine 2-epimerase
MRTETEWVETVEVGMNCVVGSDRKAIVKAAKGFNQGPKAPFQIFGDGSAAKRIVKLLKQLR